MRIPNAGMFFFLLPLSPKKLICLFLVENYWYKCFCSSFKLASMIIFSTSCIPILSSLQTRFLIYFFFLSQWFSSRLFFLIAWVSEGGSPSSASPTYLAVSGSCSFLRVFSWLSRDRLHETISIHTREVFSRSHRFGESLEPWYIFGAIEIELHFIWQA